MSSHQGVRIECGAAEHFDRVEPLWLELRRHHAEIAPLWRAGLLAASFEDRKDGLLRKSVNGLAVLLATVDGRDAGYCICTVDAERQGELDSLYVTAEHRRRGLGRALMCGAMRWLGDRPTSAIVVEVLFGNDPAMRLYESLGFHARTVQLRHVVDGAA
jgi:diamine N-acetyltransferase